MGSNRGKSRGIQPGYILEIRGHTKPSLDGVWYLKDKRSTTITELPPWVQKPQFAYSRQNEYVFERPRRWPELPSFPSVTMEQVFLTMEDEGHNRCPISSKSYSDGDVVCNYRLDLRIPSPNAGKIDIGMPLDHYHSHHKKRSYFKVLGSSLTQPDAFPLGEWVRLVEPLHSGPTPWFRVRVLSGEAPPDAEL